MTSGPVKKIRASVRPSSVRAPAIPGYQVDPTPLGEGAESVVYRARRGDETFALKLLRAELASDAETCLRFRRSASTVARLDHECVVRLIEAGEWNGRPYAVMEMVEGTDLTEAIGEHGLDRKHTLKIARGLASALDAIHQHGLVHRDIKPDNVVVRPDETPKLVDFGFAAAVQFLDSSPGDEDAVLGTLLYAAPEQSGLLKRAVDGRTDLYALGALLFQCATGRPPFDADNLSDLLQQHAAAPPPDLAALSPAYGAVFARIVEKLLAKDPDDRYQSARGLLADLDDLPRLEAALAAGQPLDLGSRDARTRVTPQIAMVGRERELSILHEAWEAASAGEGRIVQVEGEPGLGKSRLLQELVERVATEGAAVLSGKAQPAVRTPLAPLREALEEWLARLARQPDDERVAGERAIRAAAGENAAIAARLGRGLERVLGEVPQLRPLEPDRERERFLDTVASLFLGLAERQGGLLLLVDDVQWLDDGSVEVLARVAARMDGVPLLVATTARNDTESDQARERFVAMLGDVDVERLVLAPLEASALSSLVSAHLGGRRLEPRVVKQLASRSNGNPFVIGEYVRSLLDQNVVRPTRDGWVVDTDAFGALDLPEDVIRLLVSRVRTLGDAARRILRTIAVAGSGVDHSVLVTASGIAAPELRRGLDEAMRANLVEQAEGGRYLLVHDRVPEALLSDLTPEERADLHQSLAEAIDEVHGDEPEMLYALARHYAQGHPSEHPRRVFEVALRAGSLALEEHSNEQAYELLQRAVSTAPRADPPTADVAAVLESAGLAAARTGRIPEAHRAFERALELVHTDRDRARLRYLIGQAYGSEGRSEASWEQLQAALRLRGAAFPVSKVARVFFLLWYWMWALFFVKTGIGFGRARGASRERREEIAKTLYWATTVTYFLGDPTVIALLFVRQLFNNHFLGNHPENAKALANYSMLLAIAFGAKRASTAYVERGLAMAEQLGHPEAIAWCRLSRGYAAEWSGDPLRCQQLMLDALPYAERYLDRWNWATANSFTGASWYQQGRARQTIEHFEREMPALERTHAKHMVAVAWGLVTAAYGMLGDDEAADRARQQQLDASQDLDEVQFVQAWWHGAAMSMLLDRGEVDEPFEEHARAFLELRYEEYHMRLFHCFMGQAMRERALRSEGADRERELARLRKELRHSALPPISATLCPVHGAHVRALRGALAMEDGDHERAETFFEQAETLADRAGSPWAHWYVLRERARLARRREEPGLARTYAARAMGLAQTHGWLPRMELLRQEFEDLDLEHRPETVVIDRSESGGSMPGTSPRASLTAQRYVEALLEVSLESPSPLDPKRQCRAALDALVKVLGAERAFLFVVDPEGEGELRMEAGRDSAGRELLPLKGYSSTVVDRVFHSGEPVVVTGTDEGEALGSKSAVSYDLRSIMAVPLSVGEHRRGVVYVDSRLAKGLFTRDQVEILRAIGNHITMTLEITRMARAEADREALEKDLALTAAVQSFFLPQDTYWSSERLELAAMYRPAERCGGDWWQYVARPGSLLVLLGDVTGHGAPAAMLTACVGTLFHGMREGLAAGDVGGSLDRINSDFLAIAAERYTMTLSAALFDEEEHTLRVWGAAAPSVYVLRADGSRRVLSCRGMPLGSQQFQAQERSCQLQPGDRVFLFTDGISELPLAGGRQIRKNQLLRLFQQTTTMPVERAATSLEERLREMGSDRPSDDMTMVVVGVRS